MTTITFCHLCHRIWKERPFLCKCHSNAFMTEVEMSDEDIEKIEEMNLFQNEEKDNE